MSVVEWLPKLDLDSWTIAEGVVEPTPGEGGPRVRVGTGLVVHCDVLLDGSGSAPVLEPGDRVLLTVSRDDPPSGVVLGKIVVKGEHLLSRARATNRIKGGSVGIN